MQLLVNSSKLFQTLDLFLVPPPAEVVTYAGGLVEFVPEPILEPAKSSSSIGSS
jgi:hypothetical protein